ncbi:hydroxysteroid 11-beta-dehydrogenase 1-like protein [Ruditapes philippinarum]|uniref:hydroxysteroid 11-beta-dehydrogenase 1-like protein n=1 Tax=Ruditapes philippinarum TaxID=129788 RepID=UPI00295BC0AF|nr:hydroxysteroid 11-beta-dehydrogenase 1-like protein [Ruditapes philippinarum]XP_060594509.1 hydroxysteroid 11-beta-dehydrogenase 1-like protein [Ruditapes philippinarum]XP_060594510.1 hydroxysteroid 11-beta-dehydrogenase 1-like protein [Ruditapes philippinarum]XP_060594511.1 hydroxysteroid 11-beta-dehydrogenase 1-like protein [Ruditapes philippinarum]XP_060594512.1 hydroxysteroid 11-beta-dehydrogenase 1-like protein [Ruditapes philippinarum]XP_060594513.1 hydroxysteroid 11-beta-dehydrogenas
MIKKFLAVLFGLVLGYMLIDDFNPETVKGKNVFITGASTGIGEQLAYHYAKLGANIVITARRERRLKEVIEKCRELGNKEQTYDYIVADMLDLNSTGNVIQTVVNKLGGRLDYLVLNHIILLDLGVWTGSQHNLSLIDKVINVNFQSYVYLASHSLPHLEESKGSIVVVSSFAGKFGQPFVSIYSASKFALDGFFGGLRQELKLRNCDISITVCVLGFIGTENAISQLESYKQNLLLKLVTAASPSDTALQIIRGGAKRVRQIYYPMMQVFPLVMLRDLFPEMCDTINRFVYTLNS